MYIAGVLLVFALLSLAFPVELASGSGLGRFLSASIALFWGARVAVQRLYYDRDFLRRNRLGDVAFTAIFTVLFTVYAAAAAGALR